MRLGEIKQIVFKVIDESGNLIIENEELYGGQANKVKNYFDLFSALEILRGQKWNTLDYSPIKQILESHPLENQEDQLNQDEFSKLKEYVSSLNQKMPYFTSIIDSVVEKQDEKIINIKLPDGINSLSGLSEINKRLETTFKLFAIDGQFDFVGFDRGTDWYSILAVGLLSYQNIIQCLDIAKRFFETKESYFKSKEAELSYRASLREGEKFDEEDLRKYCERRSDLMIEDQAQEATKKMSDLHGKTQAQLQTDMIKGINELVKELSKGTEFHLSLNPPEYVRGSFGGLQIDYKRIQQIRTEEAKAIGNDKQKELPESEKKQENDSENKEGK